MSALCNDKNRLLPSTPLSGCPEKFQKNLSKWLKTECFFNINAGLKAATLLKRKRCLIKTKIIQNNFTLTCYYNLRRLTI